MKNFFIIWKRSNDNVYKLIISMKTSIIHEKSFQFALDTIKLCKELTQRKEFILSRQLLKSGTSIGANIEESQSAESRKDFIHKLTISLKEAKETRYWLKLLDQSKIGELNYTFHLTAIDEIIRILVRIIKTSSQ